MQHSKYLPLVKRLLYFLYYMYIDSYMQTHDVCIDVILGLPLASTGGDLDNRNQNSRNGVQEKTYTINSYLCM